MSFWSFLQFQNVQNLNPYRADDTPVTVTIDGLRLSLSFSGRRKSGSLRYENEPENPKSRDSETSENGFYGVENGRNSLRAYQFARALGAYGFRSRHDNV